MYIPLNRNNNIVHFRFKRQVNINIKPQSFNKMSNLNILSRFALLSAILLIASTSCNRKQTSTVNRNLPYGMHQVNIVEVIQSSNYTYMEVEENDENFWIAVSLREAKPGEVIYYTDALEMLDFNSKELNRTFPVIYFVQDPSDSPEISKGPSPAGKQPTERLTGIEITPTEGGISLAELFDNQAKYKDKTIKIRGIVVKVNKNIMDKNWVHLQDGSGSGANYDLTITTAEVVEVGDVVTFEGTIALEKDFGSGYAYDIIMEKATASDVKAASLNM